jgi:hypothetical protein
MTAGQNAPMKAERFKGRRFLRLLCDDFAEAINRHCEEER